MLWRKKQDQTPSDPAHPPRPGAKNRPTPRRRDQEAANRRPIVTSDRKAAARADKAKRREGIAAQRSAMMTGDEANLPARDKGPERRYVRDFIDARFNVGEVMLPVMVIVLGLSLIREVWAQTAVFVGVYGLLLVAAGDAWFMWRTLKRQLLAKFGAEQVKGLRMYAAMRAFQVRRWRLPRPVIPRGQYPS
ncbi:MAG: DUF3043 domain-containing protein [Dermatophilaceae bacterium]